MRTRLVFKAICWLPIGAFLLASVYVRGFEGWGAWAAASVFVPVIGLSALMGLAGALLWLRDRRRGRHDPALLVATLLAGSVSGYFLLRMLVVG